MSQIWYKSTAQCTLQCKIESTSSLSRHPTKPRYALILARLLRTSTRLIRAGGRYSTLVPHTSTRFIRSDVTASILFYPCHWRNNADRTLVPSFGAGEPLIVLVRSSVVEPAGDGLFSWSRSRWKGAGSSLLLCDIGVLRRQSCCNSCKFSQIVTIVAQIVRTKEEEWEKIALENCYRYHWQQMIYHCNFIRPLSLWLLPPQHTCMFQGLGPDGNYGLFPANYVEVIDNSELQIQA